VCGNFNLSNLQIDDEEKVIEAITKWVQDFNRGSIPCLRSMPDITLPNFPGVTVLQDHYESHYKK
jgi:hypothetical protein